MIHPRLATMLVVITTDYPLAAGEPETFLRPAVEASFNRISVDGDCSTNDAVILLANGASGAERDDEAFAAALHEVCADLSRQVVADGEGATVVLEIGVTGAASERGGRSDRPPDRDLAARQDGRFRARPQLGTRARGRGLGAVRRRVRAARHRVADGRRSTAWRCSRTTRRPGTEPDVSGAVCRIDLDLGLGDGAAGYLASDLTYDYVRINAEYTT